MNQALKGNLPLTTSPACYAVLYPALQEVANAHGYALAIHGSMARDFDLVAVPWQEPASEPLQLILALKEVCGGVFTHADFDDLVEEHKPTEKPHGRLAWSIHLTNDGMFGPYLDVSVMPLKR